MTTASICTIGDEILIGQIVDTNSSYISRELNKAGIKVRYMLSIGDNREEIISNIDKCLRETDITIVTGGLGPTRDDITKDALAELTGAQGYVESPEQLEILTEILTARGIALLDVNKAQAMVPDSCKVIPNRLGTAPVMEFIIDPERYGHKAALYSLPGVPFEAIGALPDVMESICRNFATTHILHKTIVTFGIAESSLSKLIESWEESLPEYLHLAYLPNPTLGVRLRLSCYGADEPGREERLYQEIETLKAILGNAVYGEDEDSLQSILPRILKCPPEAAYQETLAVAESCTGGRVSELITSVAGCSAYYKGSVTSYSNEVKMNVLGVPEEVLKAHGAVSRQTAEAMARGVATLMDTDYSIATTGVAGPGGGSPEKPVGTCWIAAAHKSRKTGDFEVISKKLNFNITSRAVNVERFAANALNLLRTLISQQLF
ncbi:MAG: CinA family nicotinamide mononucleotide deamidase-related protein [Bacteroidales bacterium]|nr:CinA family nicotinamide mononucleotide deamidase-related protein [Bacteroidales bacterium]